MQTSSPFLALPFELRRLIYAHVISESSCPPCLNCRDFEPTNSAFIRYRPLMKSATESISDIPNYLPSQEPFWPPANVSTTLLSVNRSIHAEFKAFLSDHYTPRLIFSMLPHTPSEWVQSLRIDIAAVLFMDRGEEASNSTCDVCRLNNVNDLTTIEARVLGLTEMFPCLRKLHLVFYPYGLLFFMDDDQLLVISIALTRRKKLLHSESQASLPPPQFIAGLDPAPTPSEQWSVFNPDPLTYDWVNHFHKCWNQVWNLDEVAMGILSPMSPETDVK